MSNVMSTTQMLAADQVASWSMDDDKHVLLFTLGGLVIGFWLFMFVKALLIWRADD